MINKNDLLAKIVVFDSGLGSLSIIKEIQKIADNLPSFKIEINTTNIFFAYTGGLRHQLCSCRIVQDCH